MSYSDLESFFLDVIKYNEENIELLGTMQIPITNVYYFSLLDQSDSKINEFFSYITDSSSLNPFSDFRNNISFDEEQICQINIVKSTLKQIDHEITKMMEVASESSAKIVLLLDIGLLFNLINIFKDSEQEIHLYDFILYKFKNKINKLFILDHNSILTIGDKKSSVFDELNMYLSKNKPPSKNITNDPDVKIYKTHDSLYWKLLNQTQHFKYIDDDNSSDLSENGSLVELEGEECILTDVKLSKICFSNLFELHSNVLDPCDKLKILSIFE
jgi:hypothetical protein